MHITTTDMSLDWLLGPQLRAFQDAGYEVIGVSAPGPHVPAIEAMGIRHIALDSFTRSLSLGQDVRALVDLVRLLRRLKPDIVHTHNPKPGVYGRIAARLAGVPLVVNTQHGLYALPEDRLRRRLPVYLLERAAAAFSHAELVQNPEDATTLVRQLHVPAERVQVLGNGIDLERFDPTSVPASQRRALRSAWGIGENEVVVGVVARLVAEKGIAEILAAAEALATAAPRARLVIVGPTDPAKADAVDAGAIARAEAHGVVFAGERADMPEVYAAFDIFLTASWREGVPRAAMEAAAMGLPTVATDVRGNRQVIVDGRTGLLVPVRNPAAIAAACARLVHDAAARRSLGAAAAERAQVEFDDRSVVRTTLRTYAAGGVATSRTVVPLLAPRPAARPAARVALEQRLVS